MMKLFNKIKAISKNSLVVVVILSTIISSCVPVLAIAQSSQTQGYIYGTTNNSSTYTTGLVKTGLTSVPYCYGTQILGRFLVGAISNAIDWAVNTLMEALGVTESKPDSVPAHEDGESLRLQNTEMNARVGKFAPFGIPIGVSWDSVAFCVVNTILESIINSTIEWANNGFNGNPTFLENPSQFFSELADYEAGKFIQEIVYDETGYNVCEPFRIQIGTALSSGYGGMYNYGYYGSCSLSDIQIQNVSVSGGYRVTNMNSWYNLIQPNNNPYGTYLQASDMLQSRINRRGNVAQFELSVNKGFLNFKKCEVPGDESTCKTYTPGVLIQESLSKSLNIPKDRLIQAQKFDQLVDALVNNLIRIALNKVLEKSQ